MLAASCNESPLVTSGDLPAVETSGPSGPFRGIMGSKTLDHVGTCWTMLDPFRFHLTSKY